MDRPTALTLEHLDASNVEDLIGFFSDVDATYFHHTTRADAERFLSRGADVHVLGRDHGKIVAFGMLRGWQDGFDVPSLGIAVRRGHEGQGIGRAMMASLARLAVERGASRIRLRVHRENVRARRLYEACGYREIGVERGELLLVLDLLDPARA